jgi:signal transduction histidine kinase
MALFTPRQLPLKIVLLLALFSLIILNAGGWYLYNAALVALDRRMAAQLWSVGRTAALGVEIRGLPELLELVGDDWPEIAPADEGSEDRSAAELAFLGTLEDLAAYLDEVAARNDLRRIVLMDPAGRMLIDSTAQVGFGEEEIYIPLDRAEMDAALRGEEAATVTYPYGEDRYKRAYVPVGGDGESGKGPALVLAIEAGSRQFREMEMLGGALRLAALASGVVAVLLMILVYRTVRKNLAMERASERARRALEMGQMTAAVAHEIRNPLGIIQTNAESLRSMTDDPRVRETARDIVEESERLSAIVRRFTGLSGPEAEKPAPRDSSETAGSNEFVDLVEFLTRLLDRFRERVRERGGEVDLTVEESVRDGAMVAAPGESLESIFRNLLENSAESYESEGLIKVRISSDQNRLRVEVEDTGRGMTRDEAEAAMQPFHTTKEQGTGIGLSLAKSRVMELGGTLEIRSRRGKGTKVEVWLPKAEG